MANKDKDLSPAEFYRKYADIVKESMDDRLRYTHQKGRPGKTDDSQLPGSEYDPDTGDMDVPNRASYTDTHRELEKRGWKYKGRIPQKPGSQRAAGQVGDTDYRLGEESISDDERIREALDMLGMFNTEKHRSGGK